MFTQEVDAFLQDGGLVHLPGVARQHCAELLDEDIELVSPFLLRPVTGHATNKKQRYGLDYECHVVVILFTRFYYGERFVLI